MLGWGVALPAGVAALIGATSLLASRGEGSRAARLGWLGALAVGLGYLSGQLGVLGWPRSLATTLTTEWLPLHAAALGIALGAVESQGFERAWRWPLRFAASALLIGFMLKAKIQNTWEPSEAAGWIAASALACAVSWLFLDVIRHSSPLPAGVETGEGGPGAALTALAFVSITAGVLVLGSSLKLGQLAGVLAAAWAPLLVLVVLRPDVPFVRGALPVWLLVVQALVLRGAFYASLPKLSAGLLVAAMFGAGIGTWPLLHRRPWYYGALASAALTAVFTSGVGALTYYVTTVQAEAEAEAEGESDPSSYYQGYGS